MPHGKEKTPPKDRQDQNPPEGSEGKDAPPIIDNRSEAQSPIQIIILDKESSDPGSATDYSDFISAFEEGDLIFGFSRARKKYHAALPDEKKGRDGPDSTRVATYYTIDEYNSHVDELPGGDDQSETPKRDFLNVEKYRKELLAHAHYSPNHILPTVSRDDLTSFQKLKLQKQQAKLQRHYDNLNLHGQGDLNDADPHANQNRQFLAFRRSSKFGIEYLLSQTQKQIHFVLDRVSRGESPQLMAPTDANMASLVNPDKLQRSHLITGSELRYAFRHWNELKEKGRLFFYMGGKRVSPPWEMQAFMGMWDQYAANRIKKVEASKVEPVRPPPSRGRLLLGRPNRTDS